MVWVAFREGDKRRRRAMTVATVDEKVDRVKEKAKHVLRRLEKEKICSICYESYDHDFWPYGNNAWPVNEGKCCHSCDETHVLPARIKDLQSLRRKPA
jgi:hypothetical protein